MYKYYAFYVKIHVSGVAPCVNPSENSNRTLMENTFDEVGSLTKIHFDGYLSNRPQVSMVYKLINHAGCW